MNQRRKVASAACLLLVSMFVHAAVKTSTIRIKVLDSETHSVSLDQSGVPKNCDAVNFDAYCHNSKTAEVTNTLLVQEGNGTQYRVSCTIDSKWSRCVPLLQGASFDARKDKRGLIVYYIDDVGKLRKQFYAYVSDGDKQDQSAAVNEPVAAATENQRTGAAPGPGSALEKVKCSFRSTPPGAEITLDGQYVGSTPSVLELDTGKHSILIALTGFAQWKRDLNVSGGAELTVNAVLEKEH